MLVTPDLSCYSTSNDNAQVHHLQIVVAKEYLHKWTMNSHEDSIVYILISECTENNISPFIKDPFSF